jgi:hypothetical protein
MKRRKSLNDVCLSVWDTTQRIRHTHEAPIYFQTCAAEPTKENCTLSLSRTVKTTDFPFLDNLWAESPFADPA